MYCIGHSKRLVHCSTASNYSQWRKTKFPEEWSPWKSILMSSRAAWVQQNGSISKSFYAFENRASTSLLLDTNLSTTKNYEMIYEIYFILASQNCIRLIIIWSSGKVQAKFLYVITVFLALTPRVWGLSIIPLGEASLTYGLFCGVYSEIANSLCENLSPHVDLRAYKSDRVDGTVLKNLL